MTTTADRQTRTERAIADALQQANPEGLVEVITERTAQPPERVPAVRLLMGAVVDNPRHDVTELTREPVERARDPRTREFAGYLPTNWHAAAHVLAGFTVVSYGASTGELPTVPAGGAWAKFTGSGYQRLTDLEGSPSMSRIAREQGAEAPRAGYGADLPNGWTTSVRYELLGITFADEH